MFLIISIVLIAQIKITFCTENVTSQEQLSQYFQINSNISTNLSTLAENITMFPHELRHLPNTGFGVLDKKSTFPEKELINLSNSFFDNEMLPDETSEDHCKCWNMDKIDEEIECRCHGYQLENVPNTFPTAMEKIVIQDASIEIIRKDDFQNYRNTLKDISLNNLPKLTTVEGGVFRSASKLRSLYITKAPQLKSLSNLFYRITSKKFLILRIMHTGLESVPDLSYLQGKILKMIDLEDNKLSNLPTNSVRIKVEQLLLNYNNIETVEKFAFNGSQIAKLSLKGNRKLRFLHEDAFNGLKSLLELDLSGTSIQSLPVIGLAEIEVLRIQDTRSLKVIPSVYNFKNLKEAWLTHSFHCCAFKYPAQHDPTSHALHEASLKEFCTHYSSLLNKNHSVLKRNIKNNVHTSQRENLVLDNGDNMNSDDYSWDFQLDQTNVSDLAPIRGKVLERLHESEVVDEHEDDIGVFHQTSLEMPDDTQVHALCGKWSESSRDIACYPRPDALNPCEDIMGFTWLRVSVWFVVIAAMIGNLAVVVVFFSSLFEVSVPKFLMCHLAFADLCMGVYLLLIASMDLHSMGFYFNFAFDWQIGHGCQLAGFLTVFSSQLSVFTLTVITLERWFAIRYAIYLNRRIRLSAAAKIMTFGWLYSVLLASLPLAGISNYSSTRCGRQHVPQFIKN